MNDLELLKLAAKAAGVKMTDYSDLTKDRWVSQHSDGVWREFNPLTDDGDALRLATRLCMSVGTGPWEASACTSSGALRGKFFHENALHQDQAEAVRRVIVRAAAEVGENMP